MSGFTDNKDYKLYNITVRSENKNGKRIEHKLDILQFVGWEESGVPDSVEHCFEMIRFAENYAVWFFSVMIEKEHIQTIQGTILIHCSNGVSRCGVLIAIKYGMEMIKSKVFKDVFER